VGVNRGLSQTIAHFHFKDTKESTQSECALWQFVLALSNGQKNHSVQEPEGDEV
jgi:hypothetical protein